MKEIAQRGKKALLFAPSLCHNPVMPLSAGVHNAYFIALNF